jgi:hypothetical protein
MFIVMEKGGWGEPFFTSSFDKSTNFVNIPTNK